MLHCISTIPDTQPATIPSLYNLPSSALWQPANGKNLPAVQALCKGEHSWNNPIWTHTHSDIHMYTYTVTRGNFKLYTHTHTHTHREKCVPLIKTMLTACIQLLPCLLHKKNTKRSLVLVVTKFNAAKPILVSAILRDEFTCLSFTQYNSAQDLGGNRQLCRGSPVQFCKRQGGGRDRDSSKCMVPTFWRVRLLYSFSWVCPSPPGACHAGWVLFPLTATAETDFANSAAPGVQPEATAGIYQS